MAKDISVYIRELLFKHDCVIIPGFGAFIGNYFPSHIDRNEGLFYPPVRRITFNRHLTGNDGLLIGHVSSHLKISYSESRDMIGAWAEELRGKIMAGTILNLDHLGTFSLNREGTVIFEPDNTVNYLLSSYGLTSYQRRPVSDFDVRKKMLEHHHEPAVSQPSMKRLLTRAAVIVPVMIALALVPFNDNLFRGRMEESTLNPLANAELEFNREQIVADTAYIEPETTVRKTADTAATVAEKPVPEPPVAAVVPDPEPVKPVQQAVVVHEYRYLLIIGSFKTEDNALTMIEKLRKIGYDPEMTGGPDGFLRVSAVSFDSVEEAKAAHSRIIKNFPGAWIHKSRQ
ncbi:MAG TPA: SPOR domain-containing protein [Bacteroidales bacterium]|nr:SPOR domain-containing protein [Bacteroidales bacterium]